MKLQFLLINDVLGEYAEDVILIVSSTSAYISHVT